MGDMLSKCYIALESTALLRRYLQYDGPHQPVLLSESLNYLILLTAFPRAHNCIFFLEFLHRAYM